MPYAIFSKRTRVINRIVNSLDSLLPSEGMIEVDEEINYPKEIVSYVQGQDMNTYNLPLFTKNSTPTTQISYVEYDGTTKRPRSRKNLPRFIQPTVPGGDREVNRIDIPIVSYPFGWKAEQLFQVKYESILAQNYPFDVLIGEEFLNDEHILTGSSSDYVVTEGTCALAPGGIMVTDSFSFTMMKNIGADNVTDASAYAFDTYYLDVDPDPSPGIEIYWRGTRFSTGATTEWQPVLTNREMPTTEVSASKTSSTHMRSIQLKFTNLTGGVFALENYLLFLRLRKSVIQTP